MENCISDQRKCGHYTTVKMEIKNFVGKHFNLKKIVDVAKAKELTYLGKPKIVLIYEDGRNEIIPLAVADLLVSENPTDLTTFREKRVKPVIEQLITVLVESELKKEDMVHIIQQGLPASLQQSESNALKILFGGKEMFEITLFDIDKILKNEQYKKNGNKSGTEIGKKNLSASSERKMVN